MITDEMMQRAKKLFDSISMIVGDEIYFVRNMMIFNKIVAVRVSRNCNVDVITITRELVADYFNGAEETNAGAMFTKEDMCMAFIEGKSYGNNNPIMADEWLMDYMKQSKKLTSKK